MAVAAAVAVLASAVSPSVDASAQAAEPTAAVVLGDSYIAGEGGRWLGNSSTDWRDRDGTDRAASRSGWFWRYNPESVYGTSFDNGCNRSDVAPLASADLDVDTSVNLACSGASTIHLRSTANGGQSYKGEAPQADQLVEIAATHDVEVVAVSVGGNDLNFSGVILDCVSRYVTSTRWLPNTCNRTQDAALTAALPDAMAGVAGVLADVRAVLDANGDRDARLILVGYPSPVVPPTEARFVETGWQRTFLGGCPFWDADLAWANDSLIPRITESLAAEAAAANAEFLDLSAALSGHEACSDSAEQGVGNGGATAEWIRFLTTGVAQGQAGESLHPNAYGQLAIGRCLALAVQTPTARSICSNTPGSGPEAMVLTTG